MTKQDAEAQDRPSQAAPESIPTGEKRAGSPLPQRRRAPLVQQADALSTDRLRTARITYRGYFRWLRLERFALAAFVLLAVAFFLWALPWLPSGLDASDYTPKLAFTVYLVGAVAIAGILAFACQEFARRKREALLLWSAVFDETTGLRTRQYLYDRLALECDRAARNGGTFTFLVIQVHMTPTTAQAGTVPVLSSKALQDVASAIDALRSIPDVVALLGGGQLGILAMNTDRSDRERLLDDLRSAVAEALPRLLHHPAGFGIKAGAATYGIDGTESRELIQAARTAALLSVPPRTHAA